MRRGMDAAGLLVVYCGIRVRGFYVLCMERGLGLPYTKKKVLSHSMDFACGAFSFRPEPTRSLFPCLLSPKNEAGASAEP